MRILVNNEERAIESDFSIAHLLQECNVSNRACAVEVNHKVVPRREHETYVLHEGDCVEIVTLVGGG